MSLYPRTPSPLYDQHASDTDTGGASLPSVATNAEGPSRTTSPEGLVGHLTRKKTAQKGRSHARGRQGRRRGSAVAPAVDGKGPGSVRARPKSRRQERFDEAEGDQSDETVTTTSIVYTPRQTGSASNRRSVAMRKQTPMPAAPIPPSDEEADGDEDSTSFTEEDSSFVSEMTSDQVDTTGDISTQGEPSFVEESSYDETTTLEDSTQDITREETPDNEGLAVTPTQTNPLPSWPQQQHQPQPQPLPQVIPNRPMYTSPFVQPREAPYPPIYQRPIHFNDRETPLPYRGAPRPPPSAAPSTAFSFAAPTSIMSGADSPASFRDGGFSGGFSRSVSRGTTRSVLHRGSFPPAFYYHANGVIRPGLSNSVSMSSIHYDGHSARSSASDVTAMDHARPVYRRADYAPSTSQYSPASFGRFDNRQSHKRFQTEMYPSTSTFDQPFYSPDLAGTSQPHMRASPVYSAAPPSESQYSFQTTQHMDSPGPMLTNTPPYAGLHNEVRRDMEQPTDISYAPYYERSPNKVDTVNHSHGQGPSLQQDLPTPDSTPPQGKQGQYDQHYSEIQPHLYQFLPNQIYPQQMQNAPGAGGFYGGFETAAEETGSPALTVTPPSIYASIPSLSNPALPLGTGPANAFAGVPPNGPFLSTSNPTLYASAQGGVLNQGTNVGISQQGFYHTPTYISPQPTVVKPLPQHIRPKLGVEIAHPLAQRVVRNIDGRADSFVTAAEELSSSEEDPRRLASETESDFEISPTPLVSPRRRVQGFSTGPVDDSSDLTVREPHADTSDDSTSGTRTPRTRPPTQQAQFVGFDGNWRDGAGSRATQTGSEYSYDDDARVYEDGDSILDGEEHERSVDIEWREMRSFSRQIVNPPIDVLEHRVLSATNTVLAVSPVLVGGEEDPADGYRYSGSPSVVGTDVTIKRTISPFDTSDSEEDAVFHGDMEDAQEDETRGGVTDQQNEAVSRSTTADTYTGVSDVLRAFPLAGQTNGTRTYETDSLDGLSQSGSPALGSQNMEESTGHVNPLLLNPPSPVNGRNPRISRWSTSDSSASSSVAAELKRHSIASTQSGGSSSVGMGSLVENLTPRRMNTLRHVNRKINPYDSESTEGSPDSGSSTRESGVALTGLPPPPVPVFTQRQPGVTGLQPRATRRMIPPKTRTGGPRLGMGSGARIERRLTPPVNSGFSPRQMVPRHVPPAERPVSRISSNTERSRHTPPVSSAGLIKEVEDPLTRKASVYSNTSGYSVSDVRTRRELCDAGAVPVVLIPERSSSGRQRELRWRERPGSGGSLAVAYTATDGQRPTTGGSVKGPREEKNIAVRIEPPKEIAGEDVPGGFSPTRIHNAEWHGHGALSNEDVRKREFMLKTPFSIASIETTGTTLEMSEAKAVNIYAHQNSSVLMVDNESGRRSGSSGGESPVGDAYARGRSRTPLGDRYAEGPSRNPRAAPVPPPHKEMVDKERERAVFSPVQRVESTARRSLSAVRRALSRRRDSVDSTTEDRAKGTLSRAFTTVGKRNRHYPPASGNRNIAGFNQGDISRSNSDPAPRPSSSLFRRSKSVTGNASRPGSSQGRPVSRAGSITRGLSNKLRSLTGGQQPEEEVLEKDRRVIGRSASGTLRVVKKEDEEEGHIHQRSDTAQSSRSARLSWIVQSRPVVAAQAGVVGVRNGLVGLGRREKRAR